MRNKINLSSALLFVFLASFILTAKVSAVSATPIQDSLSGITVSPAFQQVSVSQTEPTQPVIFIITNNTPSTQSLTLTTQDFNTLSETGGLFFVGANPTQLQKKYGLAKWINLPKNQLTLATHQTAKVEADILNLPDLAPGGHYGALMIGLAGSTNSGQNNVNLHPIASSLMFVTKLGGDTHVLSLSKVYLNHTLFKLPSSVTLRFKNDGNTHVTPRGIVTITGPSGKEYSRGIINEDSGLILPQTYRRFAVPLQQLSQGFLPGKYTVKVDFRVDGTNQFREYRQSIIFIPLGLLIILVLVLMAAIFLLLRMRLSKRHKKS